MSTSRDQEGLLALGKKTEYKSDYAPEVLETFENKHPENDYWVQFNCPEFTSLVQLQVSLISLKSKSPISQANGW